jgi:hypothetical protein
MKFWGHKLEFSRIGKKVGGGMERGICGVDKKHYEMHPEVYQRIIGYNFNQDASKG